VPKQVGGEPHIPETPQGDKPEVPVTRRLLIGEPLPSQEMEGQLLPKRYALPIFASDPLSSVAYAPQEMLLLLMLGGTGMLQYAWPVGLVVVGLLAIVVLSYRQVIKGYPNGGGSYEVVRQNLGHRAGLVVAAALLVDYVLTVAVSIASGVDNIVSAIPVLQTWRVPLAIGCVLFLLVINLRGTRDSSKTFAIPTYVFLVGLFAMIVVGLVRTGLGDAPVSESAQYTVHGGTFEGAALILLLLRAFASGCAALTGVEAISNGVPAFREPKIRNAQSTLTVMGAIAIALFLGITTLSLISGVHYVDNPCQLQGLQGCGTALQRSVIAQLSSAVFGDGSFMFYLIQAATAVVLLFAANTAFNGLPMLGAILAKDQYAPKSMAMRGDRLVYSNSMMGLGAVAIILLLVTAANVSVLIQMYVIGVFVAFTLAQIAMVRHWHGQLSRRILLGRAERRSMRASMVINLVGATLTGIVLIIVTITKFTHGAWVVFIAMPLLVVLMMRINAYYARVDEELAPDAQTVFGSAGDHAVVLVDSLSKPILKSLDYAIASRHESLEAVHCIMDPAAGDDLQKQWKAQNIKVPLRLIPSPYRDVGSSVAKYLRLRREEKGSEVITIYMPHLVVGHWWENLLHNRRARHIRDRLLLIRGVEVTLVPWLLASSERLYTRIPWAAPLQTRAGIPVRRQPIRPPVRKPLPPAASAHKKRRGGRRHR
jgi:amino acid transporter